LRRLIDEGGVLVNGEFTKASYRVALGDAIEVHLPEDPDPEPKPEPIALDVVYEDDDMVVINKPAGLVVHPAPGHEGHTLVNALLARYPALSSQGGERPGIVHRLDRDTSGLILVALNQAAKRALQAQFKERTVTKTYLALVEGVLEPPSGAIEAPIGRDPRDRKRMAVVTKGRPARTTYQVREYYDRFTLVEVGLETGRTHQIRVHMAAIGHPVVGDAIYGSRTQDLPIGRQFLHAWRLGLTHPATGDRLTYTAPLPPDLWSALAHLESSSAV
jgi:23S rRNA pseudouridine1911/1915/1917 synthase